jgi:hypothetical protein
MALLRVLCWALIFILRLRFPSGSSIATIYNIMLWACINLVFSTKSRQKAGSLNNRNLLVEYVCMCTSHTLRLSRLLLYSMFEV